VEENKVEKNVPKENQVSEKKKGPAIQVETE